MSAYTAEAIERQILKRRIAIALIITIPTLLLVLFYGYNLYLEPLIR